MTQIIGQGTAAAVLDEGGLNSGITSGQGYGGWQVPDVVANLRVDQAWGNAQVMGALHEVNAPYYASAVSGSVIESNGHPSDAWGWAVGAGLHINMPGWTDCCGVAHVSGDYIEGEVNYAQGATKYTDNTPGTVNQLFGLGSQQTFGITSDCVYSGSAGGAGNTNCLLTTAWSAVLAYEHFWSPNWHQSFAGSYGAESYSSQANAILCSAEGGGNGAGLGTAATATAGCNNNWSFWTAGSRLQWDVTKSFYIGVEALYIKYNSAQTFNGLIPTSVAVGAPSTCSVTAGNCTVANQSDWAFTLRIHKDFLP